MDSNPFPLLEKSHALRRDQIHGQPQEKRFDFRHAPLGTKILKLMDGNAQETVRAPISAFLESALMDATATTLLPSGHSALPLICFRKASFDGRTVLAVEARRYMHSLIPVVIILIAVVMAAQRQQVVIQQIAGNLHSLLRAHVAGVAEMNARPDTRLQHLCRRVRETIKRP